MKRTNINPRQRIGRQYGNSTASFLYGALAVCALAFLSFLAGYGAGTFGMLKGRWIDDAMIAARSLYSQLLSDLGDPYDSTYWRRTFHDRSGVTVNEEQRSWDGYTLYASANEPVASLIDMNGNQVWKWKKNFREIWPVAPHKSKVANNLYWRKAVIDESGNLLAIYEGEGVTPSGHGLVKLDKDSNLIWKLAELAHHDVRIGYDGNVYTLTHKFRHETLQNFLVMVPPILADDIVVLSPDGEEIARIDVIDAISRSEYRYLLRTALPNELGDYLHTNTLQPLSPEVAAAFDFAEAGQILLCLRELSALVLVDPRTQLAVWAMRGPWVGQHDAEMLPNGNILIYDNRGHFVRLEGASRILEFDPNTLETLWYYTGTSDSPFDNDIRGSQQRLPNGNTLITDSQNGRIFEVTPDSNIVWEFFNPVRGGENNEYIATVMWGERYSDAELDFLR